MCTVVLQVEGLRKTYGQTIAVDDLSLAVLEGEVFGLLGPNGAGKTTSINMLCGLLKPDAGRVLIDGQPVRNGSRDVRTRVGVCPQEIILWERLTCIEQLTFVGQMYGLASKTARQRGESLLDNLGLTDKRDQQAGKLSGGMKRRLNLALALIHEPDIIVLDEPEAGLDPQSRVKVRDYIRQLAASKTIILTTHNMDEADRLADRVAIIDHGRLLELDTPENLKKRVGEGDVLEITLEEASGFADGEVADEVAIQSALADLPDMHNCTLVSNVLTVQALNIVNRLPEIIAALNQAGFHGRDVRLRAATLEDVFIQLTGRRLRE
jgi:ABC-2 type transport system ATP-binding protein